MKYTAQFKGMVDQIKVQEEFADERTLDDWHPYPPEKTKEVCSRIFLGSKLLCACSYLELMFVALDRYDSGCENWYFHCYVCGVDLTLQNVSVSFREVTTP